MPGVLGWLPQKSCTCSFTRARIPSTGLEYHAPRYSVLGCWHRDSWGAGIGSSPLHAEDEQRVTKYRRKPRLTRTHTSSVYQLSKSSVNRGRLLSVYLLFALLPRVVVGHVPQVAAAINRYREGKVNMTSKGGR